MQIVANSNDEFQNLT